MLEGIKAFISIAKLGTISEAAVQMRLTQSAVSKRIQSLENELGYAILEKDGRKVRLTHAGQQLLEKSKTLLNEIEMLKDLGKEKLQREYSIGIADSIASSWGPSIIRKSLNHFTQLKLNIHVHRSTFILEQIKLGKYDLGIVTGNSTSNDLVWNPILKEELVLVGGAPDKKANQPQPIVTIETASSTWKEIGTNIMTHPQLRFHSFLHVESFNAAAQMGREGFGLSLIPIGVAKAIGLKANQFSFLSPKIERQVYLISRKSISNHEIIQKFIKSLPNKLT